MQTVTASMISEVMALPKPLVSFAELDDAVAAGLPKSSLRAVVATLFTEPAARTEFLYRLVPEATFKRRKGVLSHEESQRAERLARVVATAQHVLGSDAGAREFLVQSHPQLNEKRPIEVATSELGARRIEQLLWGLFYGLPV